MKAAIAVLASVVVLLLLLPAAIVVAAVLQPASAQSFDERLSFYPEVPTDKNDIAARIFFTTPTPCEKVELQDFGIQGRQISINVKVTPPSQDTICAQVLKGHSLEQKIGTLKAGAYAARLYVNGEERAKTSLSVTERGVAVLATGKYVDEQGDTILAGEIQNVSNQTLSMVAVNILFFDKNAVFREDQVYTTMAALTPGGTSGFSLPLRQDLLDKEYSVRITSFDTIDPPEKVLRLAVEPRAGQDGYGEVVGSVTNNSSDRNATQVKIVCTIYDAGGMLVDSIFGYTDPQDIAPHMGAPFTLLTHNNVSEFTASCNAESREFATFDIVTVPEFPAAPLTAFVASLAALAIYRFRDKF
ncbi:MAG: FxLYD domain-containing protein [Nitrososphaera sp.]|jgi:hypothetical protein